MPRLTYERIKKECEELGIKLDESKEEYLKTRSETKKHHNQYICIIPKCGHQMRCQYRYIKTTDKCYDCRGILANTDYIDFCYKNVKAETERQGVELIDNEEDITKNNGTKANNSKHRINIKAKCGHPKNVLWSKFYSPLNKFDSVHLRCEKCTNEYFKNMHTGRGNVTMKQEEKSVHYLCSILTDFEIYVNCEGCQADVLVRPKTIDDDKWVKVQCKSTYNIKNSFSINKKSYPDNIMLFHHVTTNKIWVMPPNTIQPLKNIEFPDSNKSKYYQYKIDNHKELNEKIMSMYFKTEKFDKETVMCPTGSTGKLEYEHRILREKSIKYFDFKTLYAEHTDFMVDNKRFQEKTKNHDPKCPEPTSYHFALLLHNTKRRYYKKGDNDFYWFNLAGTNIFYVIPEQKLLDGDVVRRTITLHSDEGKRHWHYKDNWTSEYKFNYETINEEGERNRLVSMIESV